MRRVGWIMVLALLLMALPASAQEAQPEATPTPEPLQLTPETVEIETEDGLTLVADWYLLAPEQPTVLLQHQLYTNRTSWQPLIGLLLGAGYNVLNPDVRGMGESRGAIDWYAATDDVGLWLNWLRELAGVSAPVSIIGSSMGSTLAVRGCAAAADCATVIALSPGLAYYRVSIETALQDLADRRALMIYAERDRWPALGMPQIIEIAPETVAAFSLPGNLHGMDLLRTEHRTLVPLMLDWLAEYGQ